MQAKPATRWQGGPQRSCDRNLYESLTHPGVAPCERGAQPRVRGPLHVGQRRRRHVRARARLGDGVLRRRVRDGGAGDARHELGLVAGARPLRGAVHEQPRRAYPHKHERDDRGDDVLPRAAHVGQRGLDAVHVAEAACRLVDPPPLCAQVDAVDGAARGVDDLVLDRVGHAADRLEQRVAAAVGQQRRQAGDREVRRQPGDRRGDRGGGGAEARRDALRQLAEALQQRAARLLQLAAAARGAGGGEQRADRAGAGAGRGGAVVEQAAADAGQAAEHAGDAVREFAAGVGDLGDRAPHGADEHHGLGADNVHDLRHVAPHRVARDRKHDDEDDEPQQRQRGGVEALEAAAAREPLAVRAVDVERLCEVGAPRADDDRERHEHGVQHRRHHQQRLEVGPPGEVDAERAHRQLGRVAAAHHQHRPRDEAAQARQRRHREDPPLERGAGVALLAVAQGVGDGLVPQHIAIHGLGVGPLGRAGLGGAVADQAVAGGGLLGLEKRKRRLAARRISRAHHGCGWGCKLSSDVKPVALNDG
ncbi:MAG: hypothetical protein J3K34DRAFT_429623 [Monoraphidium minutum]|nr:MAG: hypothetical protein J3K34DRAFT_429623 [Monoraphidium minutum]